MNTASIRVDQVSLFSNMKFVALVGKICVARIGLVTVKVACPSDLGMVDIFYPYYMIL